MIRFWKIKLDVVKKWLIRETKVATQKWYVWLSLIVGIMGLIVSLWALLIPIQKIQNEIADIKYDFAKVFNQQTIDTSAMKGDEIIKVYYDFLNSGDYEQACVLLSTQMCSHSNGQELTKWVDDKKRYNTIKLKDGEKLEKTWFSEIQLKNTESEIWCGEISFTMSTEDKPIKQINEYTIAPRPDGNKEIRRTLCEHASKNGEDRSAQMKCYVNPKPCLDTQPN
jgi:hypothetical protein